MVVFSCFGHKLKFKPPCTSLKSGEPLPQAPDPVSLGLGPQKSKLVRNNGNLTWMIGYKCRFKKICNYAFKSHNSLYPSPPALTPVGKKM